MAEENDYNIKNRITLKDLYQDKIDMLKEGVFMTAYKENEYRKRYGIEGGLCWCGLQASQMGHRLPQSKVNLKKYGAKVIHNNINLVPVCGLEHNDKVNIGCSPRKEETIVELIKVRGNDILTAAQIDRILE